MFLDLQGSCSETKNESQEKTKWIYFIQKKVKENPNFIEENLNDICASIQYTIVEILLGEGFAWIWIKLENKVVCLK